MTLSSLDMWRLADDLSVLHASVLIAGGDPSHLLRTPVWMLGEAIPSGSHVRRRKADESPNVGEKKNSELQKALKEQREATEETKKRVRSIFEVLKSALLNDRLSGTFVFDFGIEDNARPRTHSGVFSEAIEKIGEWEEPNWDKTTVPVELLKQWLDEKNVFPEFFFPGPNEDSFENRKHDRYSPELACAVAAWKAVTQPDANKSVKATLDDWIAANAVSFGVDQGNGVPSQQAKDRIATLVNWQKKGGAPSTPNSSGS